MINRRLLSSLGLGLVLAYGLAVVLNPRFRPDQIGPYALLVLILALVSGWRQFRAPPRSFWLVVLAGVLLIPGVTIARGFGRIDMISMLFHADFGMAGATLDGLEGEITQACLSAVVICLCLALLGGLWHWGGKVMLGLCLGLLVANPVLRAAGIALATPAVHSDLVQRFQPPALIASPAERPDLVVLYLEGTDRQFADPQVWPGLYDPLHALAAEGLSFTRVGQIEGTGWSMAGMLATQCGVPIVAKSLSYRNNFSGTDRFMPTLACLGDVLGGLGYNRSYVVGGAKEFGGIDALYQTHGQFRQIDIEVQKALYPPAEIEAALGGWVLDDQMVLQTARKEFTTLAATPDPLLLVVETIGPHGRKGILSRRCGDGAAVSLSTDARAVVSCLVTEAVDFVRDIQREHAKTRPGRRLQVAILSDHLSHNKTLPDVAAPYQQANTVILLGGAGPQGRVIDKPGAMIDVYPTILDWLGMLAPPHAAHLGRSLLRPAPTIIEAHGLALFDRMLVSDVTLANRIWAD